MADSETCKRKRKPNWTQKQLLLLAQLVNEHKDVIQTKNDVWENICVQINAACF